MTGGGGPYAAGALAYRDAGWRGVLPLPAGRKWPPPRGFTGWAGIDPSRADVQTWLDGPEAAGNIALRLPVGVLGIDVDAYPGKGGGAALAALSERLGPLPATWKVTSRDDDVSGIRLYRAALVPGRVWVDEPGGHGAGIESVHFGHRYAVVAPSTHPDTGRKYVWYRPDGTAGADGEVPPGGGLPELPAAWRGALSRTGEVSTGGSAGHDETVTAVIGWRVAEQPCERVSALLDTALRELAAARGGAALHPSARDRTWELARLGHEGHAGVRAALAVHFGAFVDARGTARGEGQGVAEAEWWRLVRGAVGKLTGEPAGVCDCAVWNGSAVGFPDTPADEVSSSVPALVEAARAPADAALDAVVASVEPPRSSWTPVDLTDVLAGKRERVVPELGRRNDGIRLLYRGKEHSIAGEPETGKTWFALMIAADVLIPGGRVVYVDFEDDEWTVVGRLLTLGVLASRLTADAGQFRYVRPDATHTPAELLALLTFGDRSADLMVLDGVTEGMALFGLKPSDGGQTDAARWRRELIRPALDLGVATLATDHVVKDKARRGRFAIGDQHKFAGLTGAQWLIEQVDPFGRGLKGRSRVLVSKDRNGGLRQHGRPDGEPGITHMGDLVGDATTGELTSLVFWPPFEDDGADAGRKVREVITRLDELAVARRAGREVCRAALTVDGFKVANEILTEAIRVRKAVVCLSAGDQDMSREPTHENLSGEDQDR